MSCFKIHFLLYLLTFNYKKARMKFKYTIASILFSVFGSMSFAQSNLEIFEQGQTVALNGDTLKVSVAQNDPYYLDFGFIAVRIDITNTASTSKQLTITRTVISEPTQWQDQICWGSGCFDATGDPYMTPTSWAPDLTSGSSFELKPQYDPKNINGVGHYRYYLTDFQNSNEYLDSVDVILTFGTNSIKEQNELDLSFNVSPNPASNFVNISMKNTSEECIVKLIDVLGNEILIDRISGQKKIDVSNLKNGIYFVIVSSKDQKILSRKMIVRH